MSSLTKADLVDHLHFSYGLNKREAQELVDSCFEQVIQALAAGQPVKITGFGSFELRDKPARPGRNPKTGEAHEISARRVVTFKASSKMRSLVTYEMGTES